MISMNYIYIKGWGIPIGAFDGEELKMVTEIEQYIIQNAKMEINM